jgi:hypothetical protein
MEKEITKELLEEYMFARNVVRIKLRKNLIALPYLHKGTRVLSGTAEFWLGGNALVFPPMFGETSWQKTIPKKWKRNTLIPLYDNEALCSSSWDYEKGEEIPSMFYLKMVDVIANCEFSSVGMILSEEKFTELFEKHRAQIKEMMTKELLTRYVKDGIINEKSLYSFGEEIHYESIQAVFDAREAFDISNVGHSGNTFNLIQNTGLNLLHEIAKENNLDTKAFVDLGCMEITF